jgi:hypothetical protein
MAIRRHCGILVIVTVAAMFGTGCTTVPLDDARRQFLSGQLNAAEQTLANIPEDGNQVLNLMERGMVRHLRGDYAGSTMDWLLAVRRESELETHSISKAGASLIANDTALAFRGHPYERTYLHVFLARNYLAQGMWDDAAVEARNIIRNLEQRDGFPDDAYSRFLAGLCLELAGDGDGAAMQYRTASRLVTGSVIDENTGRFTLANSQAKPVPVRSKFELVCLVDMDGGYDFTPDYAEIHAGGLQLGTTYTLARTAQLDWESRQRVATKRMSKEIARIALKETLASAVEHENKDLGQLLRLLLFSMETPDERHWQTLPDKLAIARCPCPADLKSFEVVFKNASGTTLKRIKVNSPITRRDNLFFSLCRDAPQAEERQKK